MSLLALPKVDMSKVLEKGSAFFSFLIGFGIAVMLFHRPFTVEPILAVPIEELHNAVAQHDGKCYRYRVEDASCQFPSTL